MVNRILIFLALNFTAAAQPWWTPPVVQSASSGGEMLTDRWYLSYVTESNNAPVAISFTGTGSRTVDWGDGTEETTSSGTTTDTHTYSTAGSNVFTIRGSFTRVTWYNQTGAHRLRRILSPICGCTNITSFQETWRNCTSLIGGIPDGLFDNTPLVASLYWTWYGCTALTGPIPDGLFDNIPLVTTYESTFYNCASLSGSIPSGLFNTTPRVTSFLRTFYNCASLTNNATAISEIFDCVGGYTNLTTSSFCFYGARWAVGNAADFVNMPKSASYTVGIYSTNGSYRTFYGQTNLTDWATLDAAWK